MKNQTFGHLEVCILNVCYSTVTLWEIFNNGDLPWKNIRNLDRVQEMIQDKKKFKMPSQGNCPANIYKIIGECLKVEVDERPNFQKILSDLEALEIPTDPIAPPSPKEDTLRQSSSTDSTFAPEDNHQV